MNFALLQLSKPQFISTVIPTCIHAAITHLSLAACVSTIRLPQLVLMEYFRGHMRLLCFIFFHRFDHLHLCTFLLEDQVQIKI